MSQIVSLNGAPTYPDIFYFHYIAPVKLKKAFEVKLVQASYNYSNLRERTMSKISDAEKHCKLRQKLILSHLTKESQNIETTHGHGDIYSLRINQS